MSDTNGFIQGALAGQQISQERQQQDQSKQMFALSMEEGGQKLQLNDLSIQEHELSIKQTKSAIAQQEQLMRLMQGGGAAGTPQSATETAEGMADRMFQIAGYNMQVGRFDEAGKQAKDASTILKNNAAIHGGIAKAQTQKLKDVGDLLGGATDAQGWDRAKMIFTTLHPDEAKDPGVAKILGMPYSPQLIKTLQTTIQSQKDKAQIAASYAEAAARTAQAHEATVRADTLIPEQVKVDQAREAALAKAGSKNQNPTTGDVQDIVRVVGARLGLDADGLKDPSLYDRSRSVAAVAKGYITGGMSKYEAQNKAVAEAMANNNYAGIKGQVKDLGTTPDKPLQLKPAKSADPEDMKKWAKGLQVNMYYQMSPKAAKRHPEIPKGLAVWDGTNFVAPGQSNVQPPGGASDDDDGGDGDE